MAHSLLGPFPINSRSRYLAVAILVATACAMFTAGSAQAQTYRVLYQLTGGSAGWSPQAGLVSDSAGNLYGTTAFGGVSGPGCGSNGCGTVFKLTRTGGGSVYSVIYSFHGGIDGARPTSQLAIGSDGSLYGTTGYGAAGNCTGGQGYTGCGMVFKLSPHACGFPTCPWTETALYRFSGGHDGGTPWLGTLLLDSAGNIYGTSSAGGVRSSNCPSHGCGVVYKLLEVSGHWTEDVIYEFQGGDDGEVPYGGLILDSRGNLYGTTTAGGQNGYGTVYQLSPNGSGWTETILNSFTFGEQGDPWAGLTIDPAGNLYGTTEALYGAVFEVSPSGNGWRFGDIIQLPGSGVELGGPTGGVVRDSAGNLFGGTPIGGALDSGSIFELTPNSQGGWTYVLLHSFGSRGDGVSSYGNLMLDGSGNVYGVATEGGGGSCAAGCGIIWEITP